MNSMVIKGRGYNVMDSDCKAGHNVGGYGFVVNRCHGCIRSTRCCADV